MRFNPHVKLTLAVLCGFLSLPLARSGKSITSGTIIVIAQTKKSVILAGDSRAGSMVGGIIEGTDDSACKIAILHDDIIFAAAGIVGEGRETTVISEAVAASKRMPDGYRIGPDEGELILWYWAQSMVKRFSSIPTHQILQYANTNDGIVTTGVLAGKERDGSVWLRAMMITYSSSEGLSLRKNVLTSNDPPTAYFAVGKSDIFTEFEGDKTSDRAIAERRSWKRLKLKGRPFDRFKARRLVELTVLYHTPRTDVGGDVDEIELIGTGKPHWIQVKPQCKNNYSP